MARPLRYEAGAAVYHLMARGDGGKTVFEDDKDRYAWVDLMERACARFGWRVHAWVLMGNHFHLLLETPEPNLVAGMKWMLGVFSQGWNSMGSVPVIDRWGLDVDGVSPGNRALTTLSFSVGLSQSHGP